MAAEMTITWQDYCELVECEEVLGWNLIDHDACYDTWRWGYTHRTIVQDASTGKLYEMLVPITSGDNGPGYSQHDELDIGHEVVAVPVTQTIYKRK